MLLDLVLVLLVACLAFSGFRRGAPESVLRLFGLPLAYGAAVLAAVLGGAGLAARLEMPGLVGGAIVGALAFVFVHAVVGIAALRVRRRTEYVSMVSRWTGTGLGLVRGLVFAIPLLWVADLAEGARASGLQPALPDLSASITRSAAAPLFEAGGEALVDARDPSSRMTARFVADPGRALGALQDVLADPGFRVLQFDGGFWEDVERGAITRAVSRPTFRELARDPEIRSSFGAMGLVSADAERDPARFEIEIVQALSQVAPRLAALRSDPALVGLLEDPEVQYMVERGDAIALLRHPGFRALVARVSEEPR